MDAHPGHERAQPRQAHLPPRHVEVLIPVLTGLAITCVLIFMLATPSMDGLRSLPGQVVPEAFRGDLPRVRSTPPQRPQAPPLTPAQQRFLRAKAVNVARAEVGVREWGGDTNHGRRIIQYRRAVTGPGENPRAREPWCADFVSWVWRQAGHPIGFGGAGNDYVPYLVQWAKFTGRWRTRPYRPQPGDLIVYAANGHRFGHVGLVAGNRNGRLRTIEGNYKNQVSRRWVVTRAPTVSGYVTPL